MTVEGMPETEAERAKAEAYSADLATRTLATGDRLHEHICKAKIANRIPFTTDERAFLDRVIAEKRSR